MVVDSTRKRLERTARTIESDVDADRVRSVHRKFVTGVTVVTTQDDGTPRGLAVNAFCSVSLEPPVVLVCVQKTSSTHDFLWRSKHMGITILAADQLPLAQLFASKAADKFAHVDWTAAPNGSPLLANSAAAMEVRIGDRLDAHSHTVFTGQVVHVEHSDAEPLIYSAGNFLRAADLADA
jgi:flavin reductase (DIM6/NTAB) family NADH-FMN oxidoreductase RutF